MVNYLEQGLSLFSTLQGKEFLYFLVIWPIAFIIGISVLLMKFWHNKPPFTETLIFKILYVIVLYAIAVIMVAIFKFQLM